jgi:hypothetical protein
MNNLRPTSLFSVAIFLLVGALISPPLMTAQFDARVSEVVIPFTFHAGNETMPPGTYRFEDRLNHLVVLHGPNDQPEYVLVHNAVSLRPRETGTVVFSRYGETYFLKQVWYGENLSGIECYTTSTEKRMLRASNHRLPGLKIILSMAPDGGSAGARKR